MAKTIAGKLIMHKDGDGNVTGYAFVMDAVSLKAPKASEGGKQSTMAFISGYLPSTDGKGMLVTQNVKGQEVPVEFQLKVFVREDKAVTTKTESAKF